MFISFNVNVIQLDDQTRLRSLHELQFPTPIPIDSLLVDLFHLCVITSFNGHSVSTHSLRSLECYYSEFLSVFLCLGFLILCSYSVFSVLLFASVF